jgi:acyl-CoA thioester hydrolase
MSRPAPPRRDTCPFFSAIATRWMDNDIYGHVNNVVYYSYFDTVIGHYLVREAGLDPLGDPVIGMAVENGCRFHRSLAYPDTVHAGLRVGRLGTSSVRYEIGIFRNDEPDACADGHFVHVFVDRATQRPAPLPAKIRTALERLLTD